MTRIRLAATAIGIAAGVSMLTLPAQAATEATTSIPAAVSAQQVPSSFNAAEMYCSPGQDGKIVWLQGGFYECKHIGNYKFVWVPRPDRGPR
ncbi:hypothetical protein [Nocardia altamirensis]|uniref:hypothetical protein n=1 Tax=Nocardia altamirensis TaxID=472158 RepID=UPI00114CF804|nr:hypothetical protein [Nocardia altamirensis]